MGLYNWRNKLLLDLPMRAGDHDPVNTLREMMKRYHQV